MKTTQIILKNEKGSTLLVAVLILFVLTLLGLAAMTTSTIDIHIAANDKASKIAFYNADSGVYTIPKLISRTVNESAEVDLSANAFLGYTDRKDGSSFFRQVLGYDEYDSEGKSGPEIIRDVEFTLDSRNVAVDVQKLRTVNIAGGGVEFASGAEGMGVGSVGGMAVIYGEDSIGEGPRSSQSNVYAEYRKVLGMPGGL